MKSFLGTFVLTLVLGYFFLLFGGTFVFNNIWAFLVFVALFIAILVTAFFYLAIKIEGLEARIKAFESQGESRG